MIKTKKCRFCQIIKERLEPIFWENGNFYAIFDAFPNTRGAALVITKEHYLSYVFDLKNSLYEEFMLACKKVAKILDKKLGVQRTAMVMEGTGVNHAHIKLYPLWGLKRKYEKRLAGKRVFFEKYEGFITTQIGPRISPEELKGLLEKLK
jgi:diadenosine tetraphosphate (Ap4A) HIT family hydrolase